MYRLTSNDEEITLIGIGLEEKKGTKKQNCLVRHQIGNDNPFTSGQVSLMVDYLLVG